MIIAQTKCFNHPSREAVAQCQECSRFFCRECVSEYDDRLICSFCLKRITTSESTSSRFRVLLRLMPIFIGIVILWTCFYLLGKGLLLIPPSFELSHPSSHHAAPLVSSAVDP
jgi:hypothetical protein